MTKLLQLLALFAVLKRSMYQASECAGRIFLCYVLESRFNLADADIAHQNIMGCAVSTSSMEGDRQGVGGSRFETKRNQLPVNSGAGGVTDREGTRVCQLNQFEHTRSIPGTLQDSVNLRGLPNNVPDKFDSSTDDNVLMNFGSLVVDSEFETLLVNVSVRKMYLLVSAW